MKATKAGNFYISFADDQRGGFLGACIVSAADHRSAEARSRQLGIHPGGEALIFKIPGDAVPYPKDALLSSEDMARIDGAPAVRVGDLTPMEIKALESIAERVS